MKRQSTIMLALAGVACSATAQAAFVFVDPGTITVTTTQNSVKNGTTPQNLVNDLTVTSETDVIYRPFDNDGASNDNGLDSNNGTLYRVDKLPADPGGTTVTFTFDMGADVDLTNVVLWNYFPSWHSSSRSGIKDFTLSFATDVEGTGNFGLSIGNFNGTATRAEPGTSTTSNNGTSGWTQGSPEAMDDYTAGETFDFPDVTARYVLLTPTSTQGEVNAGLTEVRFSTVPEPGTMSLLLAAGGMLVLRRRNSK